MKIDNSINNLGGVRAKTGVGAKGKAREQQAGSGGVHDNVSLSSDSARLSALESALAEVDVEDAGKIDSVRAAIASGQFRVDEEVVADKMVESSIEQLSHQKP